jgi:regulation of enolase protein 1 (concanavalin A-like superfamily)
MVRVDDRCWVKAGIEFTDGVPRLSCVVTNDGYSDWSTQAWQPGNGVADAISIRIRVSKLLLPGTEQGPCLVMEACAYKEGDGAESSGEWFQVRIASLRSGNKPWSMGVFAICPVANKGCRARFHHLELGAKCNPVHKADNPLDAPAST